jgi:gas vesicle protein
MGPTQGVGDGQSRPAFWKRDVRVTLPRVGLLVVLATAVLIAAFAILPDFRPGLTFGVAVIASEAGLVAAYYVGQSLRESAAESARAASATARAENFNRTMIYTSRWGDPGLRTARTAFREIVDAHHDKPEDERRIEIRNRIEEDAEVEMSLITCMNLLEDLALAVHEKMVDEEVVFRFYRTTVRWCWETLEPWVEQVRARRGPLIYAELQKLYNSWKLR